MGKRGARRARAGQSGFTLIEVLLVSGMAMLMAIAALAFGNKVWENAKVSTARDLAQRLSEAVGSRYATFPSYASLAGASASWINDVSTDSAGAVVGPWGPVTLAPATRFSPNDAWSMTFNQVPRGSCAQLLSTLSQNFAGYGANGAVAWAAGAEGMDPGVAVDACDGGVNTVTFVAKPRASSSAAPVGPAWNPPPASGLPTWSPGP